MDHRRALQHIGHFSSEEPACLSLENRFQAIGSRIAELAQTSSPLLYEGKQIGSLRTVSSTVGEFSVALSLKSIFGVDLSESGESFREITAQWTHARTGNLLPTESLHSAEANRSNVIVEALEGSLKATELGLIEQERKSRVEVAVSLAG